MTHILSSGPLSHWQTLKAGAKAGVKAVAKAGAKAIIKAGAKAVGVAHDEELGEGTTSSDEDNDDHNWGWHLFNVIASVATGSGFMIGK